MTEKMDEAPKKRNSESVLTKEKLLNWDKNELIDQILRLNAQNIQLKNVISKQSENNSNGSRGRNFDFSKCHYRKILLQILYFGWDYQGLSVQEETPNTIEHHLFRALTTSCLVESRERCDYARCGRTDKGVSSYGQVLSLKVRSKYPESEQNLPSSLATELSYCKILNRLLPDEIRAVAWLPLPEDKLNFNARFDCKGRHYKYYFPKSSLDLEAMGDACAQLVGTHDFRNFCKMDVGNGVRNFVRNVFNAHIVPVDEMDKDEPTSMYTFQIHSNAFLWHQIRCIMGVLLLVGQGKESPGIVQELLDVSRNPRKPQYSIALDIPLNLDKCVYDIEDLWVFEQDEMKSTIKHIQKNWTQYNVKTTMIKDFLQNLEAAYAKRVENSMDDSIEKRNESIMSYTDCLLEGVRSKIYKPLMKRGKCSTLEEKIDYYAKKKKIEKD